MNYKGYFCSLEGKKYEVDLIKDSGNTFTEILLSGSEPFVVHMNESEYLFGGIKKSTATINIVHNTYLEDLYTPYASDVQVILKNITTNENQPIIEWAGFLQPVIFEQSYVNDYETISIEANDYISNFEFVDYQTSGGTTSGETSGETIVVKDFVNLKYIIEMACDLMPQIKGYVWSRSKKTLINSNQEQLIFPEHIVLSEQNFFTEDTDEASKIDEVLNEIGKYLGYSIYQYKDYLYFIDINVYSLSVNESQYVTYYNKSNGSYVQGETKHLESGYTITRESYRGNDSTISFEPICNKIVVKDNMYNSEYFFPNIFEDNYLTNRGKYLNHDNFYYNTEIFPPSEQVFGETFGGDVPQYQWIHLGKFVADKDGSDENIRIFHRIYDNKYWESVYYQNNEPNPYYVTSSNKNWSLASLSNVQKASNTVTRYYAGGTLLDMAVVNTPDKDDYGQLIVPNKLEFQRYLCLNNGGWYYSPQKDAYRLKDNFKNLVPIGKNIDTYLVIKGNAIFTIYQFRNYINENWAKGENVPEKLDSLNQSVFGDGKIYFKFRAGNKWWDGEEWVELEPGISYVTFEIPLKKTREGSSGYTNESREILNNISWELELDEEGYAIPITDIDLNDIDFTICLAGFQYTYYNWNTYLQECVNGTRHNAYCWLKDFEIKIAEKGQGAITANDNDVTYENIINEDAVNELDDIELKITTHTNLCKPSYSNVLLSNGKFLEFINDDGISNQKPEENIINKMVDQYNSQTKNFQLKIGLIEPYRIVKGVDVTNLNQRYVITKYEVDYQNDTQELNLIELKNK